MLCAVYAPKRQLENRPIHAPKGQPATSPRQRLGYERDSAHALKGQKLMPFQGDDLLFVHSRAVPWSDSSLAFQAVDGNTRHSYFNGRTER